MSSQWSQPVLHTRTAPRHHFSPKTFKSGEARVLPNHPWFNPTKHWSHVNLGCVLHQHSLHNTARCCRKRGATARIKLAGYWPTPFCVWGTLFSSSSLRLYHHHQFLFQQNWWLNKRTSTSLVVRLLTSGLCHSWQRTNHRFPLKLQVKTRHQYTNHFIKIILNITDGTQATVCPRMQALRQPHLAGRGWM